MIRLTVKYHLLVISLVILNSLCGFCSARGELTAEERVPRIHNNANPLEGIETCQLEELWRHGGEDDDMFFGLPIQAVLDNSGNIYLLDRQLCQIFVLSPDGKHLATLSRQGDGPGEMNNPVDLLKMSDGCLGILQGVPPKIIKIDYSGVPIDNFTLMGNGNSGGNFAILGGGKYRADELILNVTHISYSQMVQRQVQCLSRYSENGKELTRYLEKEKTIDFSNLQIIEKEAGFLQKGRWTIGPEGRIYSAADWDRYEIEVHNPRGKLEKIIERDFESIKRTDKQLELAKSRLATVARDFPIHFEVADQGRAVVGLRVADDGWLWVQHGRSEYEQPAGVMRTYDLFDPKGVFRKQVAISCEGDSKQDILIFVGHDRAVLVTEFSGVMNSLAGLESNPEEETGEDEEVRPPEVIYYAVPRLN